MGQSLNEEQKSYLRNRLLCKRTSLRDLSADMALPGQSVNLQLADREISRQKEINDAILRLDTNTYGMCQECDAFIPFKRLQALPETRFCIDCEKSFEVENRLQTSGPDTSFLRGMRSYENKGY